MNEEQIALKGFLEDLGMGAEDVRACIDSMMTREDLVQEFKGILQEEYERCIGQIECGNLVLFDFIADKIKDRLTDFSPSMCSVREYATGFNIIMWDADEAFHLIASEDNRWILRLSKEEAPEALGKVENMGVSDFVIYDSTIKDSLRKYINNLPYPSDNKE